MEQEKKQWGGVEAFFARFDTRSGAARRAFMPYDNPADFANKLEFHLLQLIEDRITSEKVLSQQQPLPAATRLEGRDSELDTVVGHLLSDTPGPVAVLGGPGMGKGSLILAAIHQRKVAERYDAFRYFVRCDGASKADALMARIATALGTMGTDARSGLEDFLSVKQPILLALDGVEDPWLQDQGPTEELLKSLAAFPHVALLVAARGEECPGGPEWVEAIRLQRLDEPASRRAFLRIAGKRFTDDPLLPRVLKALDGLPLVIELMAHAAATERSLETVWTRWGTEHVKMLDRSGGKRDPSRDAETSFEMSINSPRMTEAGRRLLRNLSVLPVGISEAKLGPLVPGEGLQGAATLVKLGLAFRESGRLRVLAPIRTYVAAEYPPSRDDVHRIAEDYYLQARNLLLVLKRTGQSIASLAPEAPNIGAILRRELKNKTALSDFARTCTLLANCYANYLFLIGLNELGRGYLEDARELAKAHGDADGFALTCLNLGRIEEKLGKYKEAEKHLKACSRPVGSKDDRARRGVAAHILGIIAFNQCQYPDALGDLKQGLSLLGRGKRAGSGKAGRSRSGDGEAPSEDDSYLRCDLLERLCVTSLVTADYDAAEKHGQEGLRLARALRDDFRIAVHLKNLCWLTIERGQIEEAQSRRTKLLNSAQTLGEEGLKVAQALGHRGEMAGLCQQLGRIAEGRGMDQDARELLTQGLDYAIDSHHLWYQAALRNQLGELHLVSSREKAEEEFREARKLARSIGSQDLEAWAVFGLARVAGQHGGSDLAKESIKKYRAIGLRHKVEEVERWLTTRRSTLAQPARGAGTRRSGAAIDFDRSAPALAAGVSRRQGTVRDVLKAPLARAAGLGRAAARKTFSGKKGVGNLPFEQPGAPAKVPPSAEKPKE